MKKQFLAITLSFFSLAMLAQKDEVKAADKAFKKGNYDEVLNVLKPLENSESSIDKKYKGQYLFLKAQALEKTNKIENASKVYKKLFAFENKVGKKKYTTIAKPMYDGLVSKITNQALKAYNEDKNYALATKKFVTVYNLKPKDTSYLFNAAVSAYLGKDYETSLKHFRKLKDINYTGIVTQYLAVNVETGETQNFATKAVRDNFVKLKQYKDPSEKVLPSRRADVIKNIGYILVTQGKTEEAITALEDARKANPKDVNLIITEAQMYIDLKRMDKFEELMQEAIKLDPNNGALFYNLGVVNANAEKYDEAISYYKKAIELRENYGDAYQNLAFAYLNKRVPIVNKMNENLSNEKKYNALEKEMNELNRMALPYLEKADALQRNLDTVRNLISIYDALGMTEKANALRPVYKKMRN